MSMSKTQKAPDKTVTYIQKHCVQMENKLIQLSQPIHVIQQFNIQHYHAVFYVKYQLWLGYNAEQTHKYRKCQIKGILVEVLPRQPKK